MMSTNVYFIINHLQEMTVAISPCRCVGNTPLHHPFKSAPVLMTHCCFAKNFFFSKKFLLLILANYC